MEDESNRFEIHTPVFDKKKKYSLDKERHQKCSSESFRDSSLANEQSQINKSKKKRKKFQELVSSPLKKSEVCDETDKATSTSKKNKKRRNSALGVDEETGVAYVLVDKENIENTPKKSLKKDVDVVYVYMSKEQKSAEIPEADELHSVTTSWNIESEEPHKKVRGKKKKKRRRKEASCDAQENPYESIAFPQSELHGQESLLSVGLEDEITDLTVSANKNKSKKKKKKISNNQEYEALAMTESLENVYSERTQVVSEISIVEDRDALKEIKESDSTKKKSKKRKQRTSFESSIASVDDFSVFDKNSENTLFDSLEEDGTLIEENVKPRPKKKKTQSYPEKKCEEEAQRLESTNEEESNLESAKDSETKYLSEDSRDSDDSDVDLDSAVKQLQEFIPDIKERAATTIRRMYRDDLGRFKEFKAQGVAIKFGKFSAKENKQLEKNVEEFLSLTGIENADKLLYTDRYPEEKSIITDLKRKYSFRLHIGKGIARPWKLVYYRAKKMFDINNYKGSSTEEEEMDKQETINISLQIVIIDDSTFL